MKSEIETAIIELNPDATNDQIAELYTKVDAMVRMANELKDNLKLKMIDILKSGRKDICWRKNEDGEYRFWLGSTKSEKCISIRALLEFLLSLDQDSLESCLSSNAFKHGAVRKLLASIEQPQRYREFFQTIIKDKLESETPPALPRPDTSELQMIDTTFLR